jgi:hypothetical protein
MQIEDFWRSPLALYGALVEEHNAGVKRANAAAKRRG